MNKQTKFSVWISRHRLFLNTSLWRQAYLAFFFSLSYAAALLLSYWGAPSTSVKYFSWKSVADAKAFHKKRTGESVQRRFMVFIVVASDLVDECHIAIFQRTAWNFAVCGVCIHSKIRWTHWHRADAVRTCEVPVWYLAGSPKWLHQLQCGVATCSPFSAFSVLTVISMFTAWITCTVSTEPTGC